MSICVVPAREGMRVELDGKSAYVTPDDLLARQAYDHGISLDELFPKREPLTTGVDLPVVVAAAAEQLGRRPIDIKERATFRRIRTERIVPGVANHRAMAIPSTITSPRGPRCRQAVTSRAVCRVRAASATS